MAKFVKVARVEDIPSGEALQAEADGETVALVKVDGDVFCRPDIGHPKGEVHAIMGPNGSGKSTLAQVLMGHPSYALTQGTITFKGEDVTQLAPDQRARLGMFLAFQYPIEIPGVSVSNFLRTAV